MSNATDNSRESGQRRRRKSRGGRNRNQNNSQNRGQDGSQSGRSNRSGGGRPRRKPVPLTWWQKLLKAVGLYSGPSKPKGKRKPTGAPKSNTRIATSAKPDSAPREKESRPRKNKRGGDPSTVKSARVYVGNLSYDVTEQDLQELFKGVGTVRNAEIVYNRNTHRSKGFGFVEMIHRDDAVRSVEVLHDQPFMGRSLIVSGAKSQEEYDAEDQPQGEQPQESVELAPLPEKSESDTPESTAPEAEQTPEEEPAKAEETASEPEAENSDATEETEKNPVNS